MTESRSRILAMVLAVMSFSTAASASTIQIGLFSFDENTPAGNTFNILNLTGPNASPPEFPIETLLTFTVSNLVATLDGGATLTLGPAAFTDDGFGTIGCTALGLPTAGGCNFAAFNVTSVIINGTLSPTSGLVGLPSGFIGIQSAFQGVITAAPGSFVQPGEAAIINATLVESSTPTPVPEPSTLMLLQLGLAAVGYRFRERIPFLRRRQVSRD